MVKPPDGPSLDALLSSMERVASGTKPADGVGAPANANRTERWLQDFIRKLSVEDLTPPTDSVARRAWADAHIPVPNEFSPRELHSLIGELDKIRSQTVEAGNVLPNTIRHLSEQFAHTTATLQSPWPRKEFEHLLPSTVTQLRAAIGTRLSEGNVSKALVHSWRNISELERAHAANAEVQELSGIAEQRVTDLLYQQDTGGYTNEMPPTARGAISNHPTEVFTLPTAEELGLVPAAAKTPTETWLHEFEQQLKQEATQKPTDLASTLHGFKPIPQSGEIGVAELKTIAEHLSGISTARRAAGQSESLLLLNTLSHISALEALSAPLPTLSPAARLAFEQITHGNRTLTADSLESLALPAQDTKALLDHLNHSVKTRLVDEADKTGLWRLTEDVMGAEHRPIYESRKVLNHAYVNGLGPFAEALPDINTAPTIAADPVTEPQFTINDAPTIAEPAPAGQKVVPMDPEERALLPEGFDISTAETRVDLPKLVIPDAELPPGLRAEIAPVVTPIIEPVVAAPTPAAPKHSVIDVPFAASEKAIPRAYTDEHIEGVVKEIHATADRLRVRPISEGQSVIERRLGDMISGKEFGVPMTDSDMKALKKALLSSQIKMTDPKARAYVVKAYEQASIRPEQTLASIGLSEVDRLIEGIKDGKIPTYHKDIIGLSGKDRSYLIDSLKLDTEFAQRELAPHASVMQRALVDLEAIHPLLTTSAAGNAITADATKTLTLEQLELLKDTLAHEWKQRRELAYAVPKSLKENFDHVMGAHMELKFAPKIEVPVAPAPTAIDHEAHFAEMKAWEDAFPLDGPPTAAKEIPKSQPVVVQQPPKPITPSPAATIVAQPKPATPAPKPVVPPVAETLGKPGAVPPIAKQGTSSGEVAAVIPGAAKPTPAPKMPPKAVPKSKTPAATPAKPLKKAPAVKPAPQSLGPIDPTIEREIRLNGPAHAVTPPLPTPTPVPETLPSGATTIVSPVVVATEPEAGRVVETILTHTAPATVVPARISENMGRFTEALNDARLATQARIAHTGGSIAKTLGLGLGVVVGMAALSELTKSNRKNKALDALNQPNGRGIDNG
ncbi:MAG: hypothetical protein SFT92_00950 [Rickettsiales bacterium]|nr:hypothetical protein [Rickettsiales bacterium]